MVNTPEFVANKEIINEEIVRMLLDAIWENAIGPDILDNGDYDEFYFEEIENGEYPTYEEFCDIRWNFCNGNMSIKEMKDFIKKYL